MLPTREVEEFLKGISLHLKEIVFELRSIIVSVAPDITEVILWRGLSYYREGRGGPVSAGLCQIGVGRDDIRLEFIHGSFLPDPWHLLEGNRKYKRYVRLASYESAPWEALKELIASAAEFDPYSIQGKVR